MKVNKSIVTAGLSALIIVSIIFGSDVKKRPSIQAQDTSKNQISFDGDSGSNHNSANLDDKNTSSKNESTPGQNSGQSSSSDTGSSSNSGDSQSSSQSNGGKYKDGTYTGSAAAYKGDIKVSVVVSGGKITSIDVVESGDDEEYLSKAKALIDDIIGNQTTSVQVVSGATYSSTGIINAVSNALSNGGA